MIAPSEVWKSVVVTWLIGIAVAIECDFVFSQESDIEIHRDEVPMRLLGSHVAVGFQGKSLTDNDSLVTCDKTGTVRFFDSKLVELRQFKISGAHGIICFTACREAQQFAAIEPNGALRVGNLRDGTTLKVLKTKCIYERLLFSHGGDWLAAFPGGLGQVWSTSDWSESINVERVGDEAGSLNESIAFLKHSTKHTFAGVNFGNPCVRIYNLRSGDHVRSLSCDPAVDRKFMDVCSTPDSKYLIGVGAGANRLVVWDVLSGDVVARPEAFLTGVGNRLAVSEDGKSMVCSDALGAAFKLYRVSDWSVIGRYVVKGSTSAADREKAAIINLAVNHSGTSVATLHGDRQVRLWEIVTSKDKK